jgi:phosphohistidine phosphatase SixA
MRNCLLATMGLVLAVALAAVAPAPAAAQGGKAHGPALVLLVRHAEPAEQPDDDPGLSDAGKKRAQDLAAALRDAGVTTIIVSPFRRTRDTAAPLAAALGFKPMVVPIGRSLDGHIAAVAAAVRALKGVILVVGHGNTIPEIIAQLGGPRLPDICDSVHDDLFSLVMADGKTRLVRGRYGAPADAGANCRR